MCSLQSHLKLLTQKESKFPQQLVVLMTKTWSTHMFEDSNWRFPERFRKIDHVCSRNLLQSVSFKDWQNHLKKATAMKMNMSMMTPAESDVQHCLSFP
jgi:hypothetical protein